MSSALELDIGLHGGAVTVQLYGPVLFDLIGKGVLLVHGSAGYGIDALGLLSPFRAVVYGPVLGQGEGGGLMDCGEAAGRPDGHVLRPHAGQLLAGIGATSKLAPLELRSRIDYVG